MLGTYSISQVSGQICQIFVLSLISRKNKGRKYLTVASLRADRKIPNWQIKGFSRPTVAVVVAGFVLFKNHHIFQNKEQKGGFLSLIKNTCHLFLRKNPIFIRLNITFNLKGMKLILSSSLCTISVHCVKIFIWEQLFFQNANGNCSFKMAIRIDFEV